MGALPAGIVTVQTTWVDAMGKEGSPSLLLPVTLPDSSSMSVTIVPTQSAPPAAAVGWNVYVGANGAPPARQNAAALPLNVTWTYASDRLRGGSGGALGTATGQLCS